MDNPTASQHAQTDQTARKPYQTPRLERVYLVPDQAVLDVCVGVGKYGPNATNCQPVGYCLTAGS